MFTSKTGLTCRASMSVTVKLRTEKYSKVFTPKLCLVQKIMSAQFPARLRGWTHGFSMFFAVCQVVTDLQASTLWYGRHWEANPRSVANKLPSAGFQPVPRWPTQISAISWCKKNVQVSDRRKFRSQTSDNMERWKAEQGSGREKRKIRREKIRRERVRRKKMQMREKVGKSRNTVFFQWFVAPESRKVGSLKRRVRSQLARWEMKNCTPLWREAHFQVKMYKTPQLRTTFGSRDVEKVHAVVARSTFPSQNVQNTPCSDHFWRFRCRKSARRCGAKHISKSKCTKH